METMSSLSSLSILLASYYFARILDPLTPGEDSNFFRDGTDFLFEIKKQED